MTALRRAWSGWVSLWDGTEAPWSLAMVRLLLGSVILFDFLEIARLGLVLALFGSQRAGGLSDAASRVHPPWFVDWFGGGPGAAYGLHAAICFAALAFTLGFFPRVSAGVLLVLWAQFAQVLPTADRGIDTLCRDVLLIFLVAPSGAALSVTAWMRTGRFWGDGAPIVAWPRRLLVLQLVAMYFLAGIQKVGVHWWPPGHYAALYFILQDPAIARFDFRYLAATPFFQLTQLGSLGTILYQDTYPTVLLLRYAKWTADRGGWRQAIALRFGWLEWVWIGIGAVFHLLLALTCELGIFPWAMMALYPAWIAPELWPELVARIRRRIGREG